MSENPNGDQNHDEWQEMLRAILGPGAADEIIRSLESQGIDANEQMKNMLNQQNIGMITSQIQAMLGSSGDGPVNWKIAEKVARDTITSQHMDRVSGADGDRARNALSTASLWLDAVTDIDPTTGPNMAWSRLDWVAHSLPTFRRLLEPLGENISRAFADTFREQMQHMPPEMAQMMGDPTAIMTKIIASFLGMQYGGALAELAVACFGSTDTGIPLVEGSSAALVPANIAEFSKDLEAPNEEILLYVAVREAAGARLFTRVPWLRPRVVDTVAEFARGIEIDMESIEEQVRGMSLENPASMQELDLSGVFVMELSESQKDAIARLEHLLSLIEGWVAEVSARAVAAHLPNAVPLREMFMRRNATNNPSKYVWGSQIGVELAPRRLRDAAHFWQLAEGKLGQSERDKLWSHPDLLPNPEALDNPDKFFGSDEADIEAELDSFLADLFNDADGQGPHEKAFGEPRIRRSGEPLGASGDGETSSSINRQSGEPAGERPGTTSESTEEESIDEPDAPEDDADDDHQQQA